MTVEPLALDDVTALKAAGWHNMGGGDGTRPHIWRHFGERYAGAQLSVRPYGSEWMWSVIIGEHDQQRGTNRSVVDAAQCAQLSHDLMLRGKR